MTISAWLVALILVALPSQAPGVPTKPVVYVTSSAGLSVIDPVNLSLQTTLSIGSADGMTLSRSGDELYVGVWDGQDRFAVVQVRLETLAVEGELRIPGLAQNISVTPDERQLWIRHSPACPSERQCTGASGISVIDIATDSVLATLAAFWGGVAFTESGRLAYAVTPFAVAIIDTQTLSTVGEKNLICCLGQQIAAHPDDRFVYVLGNEFGGFLGIIDPQSSRISGDVVFVLGQSLTELDFQHDLVFSRDGSRLYLPGSICRSGVCRGALFVFDTVARIVREIFHLAHIPIRITVSSDERFAYLVNQDADTVSVVDLVTGDVRGSVALPAAGRAIAFADVASPEPMGPIPCTGDCNGDRQVTIDEIMLGVRMLLGMREPLACAVFCNSGCSPGPAILPPTVDCLLRAIRDSLDGCPAVPCQHDADCDDGNPCTLDSCSENGCESLCACR